MFAGAIAIVVTLLILSADSLPDLVKASIFVATVFILTMGAQVRSRKSEQ